MIPPGQQAADHSILSVILEISESLMTYRSRYLSRVRLAPALDLLMMDETNPRSLIFQLTAIAEHVAKLPHSQTQPLGTPEDRITSSLVHNVRMLDVQDLEELAGADRSKLDRVLALVVDQLPRLSDLVSHRYLIHAGRPQQMAGNGGLSL